MNYNTLPDQSPGSDKYISRHVTIMSAMISIKSALYFSFVKLESYSKALLLTQQQEEEFSTKAKLTKWRPNLSKI